MKVKHLREWLGMLPDKYDESELVFRTITNGEGDYILAQDIPLSACGIDDETKEAYFCDYESHKIINEK